MFHVKHTAFMMVTLRIPPGEQKVFHVKRCLTSERRMFHVKRSQTPSRTLFHVKRSQTPSRAVFHVKQKEKRFTMFHVKRFCWLKVVFSKWRHMRADIGAAWGRFFESG